MGALCEVCPAGHQNAIRALLASIEKEEDGYSGYVRAISGKATMATGFSIALGKIAHGESATIGVLLHLLENKDWRKRRNAANALAETAVTADPSVIQALVVRLELEDNL